MAAWGPERGTAPPARVCCGARGGKCSLLRRGLARREWGPLLDPDRPDPTYPQGGDDRDQVQTRAPSGPARADETRACTAAPPSSPQQVDPLWPGWSGRPELRGARTVTRRAAAPAAELLGPSPNLCRVPSDGSLPEAAAPDSATRGCGAEVELRAAPRCAAPPPLTVWPPTRTHPLASARPLLALRVPCAPECCYSAHEPALPPCCCR